MHGADECAARSFLSQVSSGLPAPQSPDAGDVPALAVHGDDVPRAEVVAVVPLRGISGRGSEVPEVRGSVRLGRAVRAAGRPVLVVARDRVADRLLLSPRRVVGTCESRAAPAVVLVVPERKDRVHTGEQTGGPHLPAVRGRPLAVVEPRHGRVAGDVTRSRDDGVPSGVRGRRREECQEGRDHRRCDAETCPSAAEQRPHLMRRRGDSAGQCHRNPLGLSPPAPRTTSPS